MCIENLKSIPEITAIGVLVGVVNSNLGEEVAVGVADGTIQKGHPMV